MLEPLALQESIRPSRVCRKRLPFRVMPDETVARDGKKPMTAAPSSSQRDQLLVVPPAISLIFGRCRG